VWTRTKVKVVARTKVKVVARASERVHRSQIFLDRRHSNPLEVGVGLGLGLGDLLDEGL